MPPIVDNILQPIYTPERFKKLSAQSVLELAEYMLADRGGKFDSSTNSDVHSTPSYYLTELKKCDGLFIDHNATSIRLRYMNKPISLYGLILRTKFDNDNYIYNQVLCTEYEICFNRTENINRIYNSVPNNVYVWSTKGSYNSTKLQLNNNYCRIKQDDNSFVFDLPMNEDSLFQVQTLRDTYGLELLFELQEHAKDPKSVLHNISWYIDYAVLQNYIHVALDYFRCEERDGNLIHQ